MSEAKQRVTISRDELYAQVWATPMSRLGAQYGISGNGLAKICDRLDVPYPPRGYWARKSAGKKVTQTPLPAIQKGTPAQVTIRPSLLTPPPPQLPKELGDALAAARLLTTGLTVSDRLQRPHPIVAGWIEARRRRREEAKRDPYYRRDLVPPDFPPIERRRHRILSALFIALEKHGYRAMVDDHGRTFFEIDHEISYFTLKEKYRQVRRPLTDEEKRRGFNPKRPWRQETQPTGLLQFSVDTRLHPALVHLWTETSEQSLDQLLPEIAAVFLAAAPLLRERRRQYEEAEQRRHEEELRRHEERRRCLQDRNRLRAFLELAARSKQVQVAREFLNALAIRPDDIEPTIGDRTIDDWITWAHDRLAAFDPLQAGASAVFRTVAAVDQWTYRED